MKHAFNTLAFLLLAIAAMPFAAADQGQQGAAMHAPGLREQMRAMRMEQQAMFRHERQLQDEQQAAREASADQARQQVSSSGSDDASRGGKMSPEERRALRRQINDAGHEIYAPSH